MLFCLHGSCYFCFGENIAQMIFLPAAIEIMHIDMVLQIIIYKFIYILYIFIYCIYIYTYTYIYMYILLLCM